MGEVDRKSYPQDVTDEEWAFVLPYLLLSREYSDELGTQQDHGAMTSIASSSHARSTL